MNELLLRRRVAASKSLPYDAEIEYLETQGNCLIITNAIPSGSQIAISTKFMFLGYVNSTSWIPWYIAYVNENTQCFRIARNGTSNTDIKVNNGAQASGAGGDASYSVAVNSIYEIETSGRSVTVNGTAKTSRAASSILNTAPMRIFNANFKGRCYYFKMWNGSTAMLDCIPVRVGTVGYMYDKVSKQLFGNAGTGSFILGPDV